MTNEPDDDTDWLAAIEQCEREHQQLAAAADEARTRMIQTAIAAGHAGHSDYEIAKAARKTRITVRRWRGKSSEVDKPWKPEKTLAQANAQVAAEWDFDRNPPQISPETVHAASNRVAHWIHERDGQVHRWTAPVVTRVRQLTPGECIDCPRRGEQEC